jgi:DNA-directed RNA polymerase I subunit RPA2
MNCSDATRAWICKTCGSFLSTQATVNAYSQRGRGTVQPTGIVRCRACAKEASFGDSKMDIWEDGQGNRFIGGEDTTVVSVPGVLRYLDVELAAMGVKMKFRVEP